MEFKRINRGRNHSYELDGRKLDGVTTVLNAGVPKPALVPWAANVTAEYAVNNWPELNAMTPTGRLAMLKAVRTTKSGEAMLRGTQIHALADPLARGEAVDVPPEHVGPVEAVARFLDSWQVVTILAERSVFHVEHGWAGTFDLLADLDGTRWLLDWKTGKGVYEDAALQLAAYNHASHLDDGTLWVPAERCGAVHVTADSATLVPVDAGDDQYTVFRHAQQVARWAARVQQAWRDDSPWPVLPALHPDRDDSFGGVA